MKDDRSSATDGLGRAGAAACRVARETGMGPWLRRIARRWARGGTLARPLALRLPCRGTAGTYTAGRAIFFSASEHGSRHERHGKESCPGLFRRARHFGDPALA